MAISYVRCIPATVAGALLLCTSWPAPAAGQVARCERPDGTSVYTDHRCADVNAVARAPAAPSLTGNRRAYRGGCARNLHDLMFQMSTAIDARDANRLANVYHWAGMSGRGGYAVMDRLDTVVRRPLIDIVPVMAPPEGPDLHAALASVDEPHPGAGVSDASSAGLAGTTVVTLPGLNPPGPVQTGYRYPASVPQAPVALRVVQTLEDGMTPSETVFDLHEHFGCVWIKS